MWFFMCAGAALTLSGVYSARQWLYGWHREDVQRQFRAALLHVGLTSLLCLSSVMLGMGERGISLLLMSAFALALGFLVIKRDPPRELSRAHIPTRAILER